MASKQRDYSDDDYSYGTKNKRRGKALIFTFRKFRNPNLPALPYTDTDYAYLFTPLKKAGFEVVRHKDMTGKNVIKTLQACAKEDSHKEADMFLCIFLTHGDGFQGLVYASDHAITLDEIQMEFKADKCPNLMCKPKYFVFQASQFNANTQADSPEMDEDQPVSQTIPVDADFLLYWCTMPGSTFFWESKKNHGTMFSRALAAEMDNMVVHSSNEEEREKEDFKMLFYRTTCRVNQQLMQYYRKEWEHDDKILPVVEDSLTKFYYLSPKVSA